MNCLSKAVLAASVVVGLAGVSTPVLAQPRDAVSARVAYADLDLASAAGQARFARRVHGAAESLCAVDTRDLAMISDSERCKAEVMASGREKLAALTAGHDVRVASRGAGSSTPE